MDPSGGYVDYPFVVELYDFIPAYRWRGDVAFFVEMARRSEGSMLELGCGTGRVLIPVARAGVEAVGIDLSPRMLAACRRKLSRESQEVQKRVGLLQEDMRSFHIGRTFDLITAPFRPFHFLLTVEDQMACLGCVHGHLSEGGRLVLDLFNPSLPMLASERYLQETDLDEPDFEMPDGRRIMRRQKVVHRDLANQITDNELIYYVTHPDGRQERLVHRFLLRYLFRYEAEHLLARSGFVVEAIYSDYDKSPFGSKYPGELIIVAKKRQPHEQRG